MIILLLIIRRKLLLLRLSSSFEFCLWQLLHRWHPLILNDQLFPLDALALLYLFLATSLSWWTYIGFTVRGTTIWLIRVIIIILILLSFSVILWWFSFIVFLIFNNELFRLVIMIIISLINVSKNIEKILHLFSHHSSWSS